eukprot:5290216-Prymnesium_polylepis.1
MPPAHTLGARPARPHGGWRTSHAWGLSGACYGWRPPWRARPSAPPSHSSRMQPSHPRDPPVDSSC